MIKRLLSPTLLICLSCTIPAAAQVADAYREASERIIEAALKDDYGYEKLTELCDGIGHRLSGSPGLEKAVQWSAEQMRQAGLENVKTQPVMVRHWVRGQERASLVAPYNKPLAILGLGGSVATPKEGITAPVIAVKSFDDLASKGRAAVEGKIVVYNPPFEGYGQTVVYRSSGASRAASLGAVAALVRSMTPVSLQSPHTGGMRYSDDAPKIPTAAVTVEDAALIERLANSGTDVRVHLYMEAQTLPDAESANVMGEIPGRERPEEIVAIGGHLDSWDVGQGAHDDGGGVITALAAVHLIRQLGLRPRRTLRVVFWTNEENGGAGARGYRQALGDSIGNHAAAIEMDGGAETPTGFSFAGSQEAAKIVSEIGSLLDKINAGTVTHGRGAPADISPLVREGVPGLGLRTVGERYFHWHHTQADTLDKVDPQDLRLNIATMAVMAYVLADMPERLPQ